MLKQHLHIEFAFLPWIDHTADAAAVTSHAIASVRGLVDEAFLLTSWNRTGSPELFHMLSRCPTSSPSWGYSQDRGYGMSYVVADTAMPNGHQSGAGWGSRLYLTLGSNSREGE